ncbi:MAG: LacI family transcriptional regulator [Rhodanobacter sp.]|jgi:LacI family transcriptional regulator|nr:LacI family transcriptional regulator [Rhodanobacter sp.]
MSAATIKDVAREAKVSVASVSRAMNGGSGVTEQTRQRIQEAAERLRYVPHAAARMLITRRTRTIGALLPDLYGEFFSELIRGIDLAARAQDLHLLVASYRGHPEELCAALRTMRGRVDGLLVMSPYVSTPVEVAADLASLPVILVNTQTLAPGIGAICIDNYGGAVTMVEHLVAMGHQQIAFIAGPEDNFDAHERRRGYREAMRRLLPEVTEWILPGDFDEASGHRAGLALLASTQRPDAVFAANDMMALGCLFALAQGGLTIPADIALAGFDDIPLARYVHPSLTTMRTNIADVGGRAVAMLVSRVSNEAAPVKERVVLTTELIVRESSAAKPAHF